jgi:hypothetical protein
MSQYTLIFPKGRGLPGSIAPRFCLHTASEHLALCSLKMDTSASADRQLPVHQERLQYRLKRQCANRGKGLHLIKRFRSRLVRNERIALNQSL